MKRVLIALLMGSLATTAFAQCHASSDKKDCAATCTTSKGECCLAKAAVAQAKSSMPQLKYAVGDQTVSCPQQAAELAKGDKKAIRFVVGESKFENEADAKAAYANALDGYLNDITSVKYAVGKECVTCPMSAQEMAKKEGQPVKYRLASFDFTSREKADDAAKAARAAADDVRMSMKVGAKSFECPMSAAEAAKAEGKTVEYTVNGKPSDCQTSASIDLLMAKIDAALSVLEKAAQG